MQWQTKNKKKWLKLYYFIILSGALAVAAGLIYTISLLNFNSSSQAEAQDRVIPPYYQPEAFKIPAELKKLPYNLTASSSPAAGPAAINLPILMYHYIDKDMPKESLIRKRLTINPQIFEEQLKSLNAAGYEYFFASDAPNIISGKIKPKKPAMILTFDDGYKDFYAIGLPFLKKYQAKATIYLIADAIGGKVYLNEAEIKELLASGLVEIGSHTLDHVALKTKTALEQKRQIEESKIALEKRFGVKIKTFAYPYGSFTAETVKLAEAAGYTCAVSVIPGRRQSAENLFYLSRLRPGDRTGRALINFLGK